MNKIASLIVIYLFSYSSMFSQGIDYKGFPEWSIKKEDSTEYALYTPSKLEAGKKYPIVLFMHGCCGVDNKASLRNAVDPPLRMWHSFGANKQTIPTYLISPATKQGWQQHFKNLKKVIDDLIANHQGDPQRVYVTGFSMGGEGTFRIIQQYPGFFAAAIPMGMSFRGDSLKVKDIPIWTNQGETDWYARFLRKQVAAIRTLNGLVNDTGNTWITGVNPRYSNFKGIGHGVQWAAASTQDLTGWAYSKINDGNIYPVVFFSSPDYGVASAEGATIQINLTATDADGSISKIDIYQNKKLVKSLASKPYSTNLKTIKGDNIIEAVAFDNRGKANTATLLIKVNIKPVITQAALLPAKAGAYYNQKISGVGNGTLNYKLSGTGMLPKGILLYPDGTVKGLTNITGSFPVTVQLTDEDNESVTRSYLLKVSPKSSNEILVDNVVTNQGKTYPVSKMMIGEEPNFNSKDSSLSTLLEEINFSNIDKYDGLTYIKTDVNDSSYAADFLSFDIDSDATIFVAYEKLDRLFTSTIPDWLKEYKKEDGEIVAQYRYFNVYSKTFKKGRVVLPGADARKNGVACHYFVMVKKKGD